MPKKVNQKSNTQKTNADLSKRRYGFAMEECDFMSTASSTDQTGMIPSLPQDKSERDSYNDVYQYLPPTVTDKTGQSKGPAR